ncbi:hypothetical protein [Lactobacillus xujianguonis]|uniref:hypothetical protein n=1 Tax=Lactobacillus xujianguonis TaxID=2495899 RepID=UPI000FDAE09D|nr:hypothetical protein [Lactobacillus xujianguonis]RVU77757.1 hypothetical protein EJK20_00670 [Lactobacillus xujianguonis]
MDGDAIVSPRRQGAGGINAGAATSSPVYITTGDGTSSLSLREIGNTTKFTLTFHNLSDVDQAHDFDDFGGSYTEQRDEETGVFSDVRIDGAPLGIADEDSLKKELVPDDKGNYNWDQIYYEYETGKVAFSPDDDNDTFYPVVYLKQNIKSLRIDVLNDKGEVVQEIVNVPDLSKSFNSQDSKGIISPNKDSRFGWNGKIYNSKTGVYENAPDGEYTYRFTATLYGNGDNKVQTHEMPIIIDTTAPVVDKMTYNPETHTLSGKYSDTGVGFTKYSHATLTINDHEFDVKLDDEDQSGFDNADQTQGHFAIHLNEDQYNALSAAKNKMTIAIADVADNATDKTIDVASVPGHKAISVWNTLDHDSFSTDTDDYDADSDTFTIRGGATHDFYYDGKLVKVTNGTYAVSVDANKDEIDFTSDKDGKNIIFRLISTDGSEEPEKPDIQFDNFVNNGDSYFNKDDEANIYNPKTHEFTVTGSVNPEKVESLSIFSSIGSETAKEKMFRLIKMANSHSSSLLLKLVLRILNTCILQMIEKQ